VRLAAAEAVVVVVQPAFTGYLEEAASLYTVGKRRHSAGVRTPRGCTDWTGCSTVRALLQDPPDTGVAYGNRYRTVAATRPPGAAPRCCR
jgi:hypothetical protein